MAETNAYPVSRKSSPFHLSEDIHGRNILAKDSNDLVSLIAEALSYDAASIAFKGALSLAVSVSAEALHGSAISAHVPFPDEAISHISAPLPQPMESLHEASPPRFLKKTYDMIEDAASNSVVSWSSGNNSFIVWSLSEFCESLLPRYFKHNNFSSFVRQLNTYGFKKVRTGRYEFAHEYFLRGQKNLLKDIHRRKSAGLRMQHKQLEQRPTLISVAENDLEGAIEQLKGDKGFLMSEIMKSRQQQQTLEKEARALADRAQALERRHEWITNFLARAIRSPAFLAHFQLQSEVLEIENEARKRRCLFPSMITRQT
ncbi:hypothetical protein GOP47_0024156 [Adiantum capillus-veneris]|uniref:HSF-type DNA-binding domain-containing protein n=1 Tax=Adiantum capillus-veneris TaxID=13818 RepID=A0A9D4U7C1_ADICA|nr:hypothetical protein GOP47_0024156 [Adiantum capillus-veneris]